MSEVEKSHKDSCSGHHSNRNLEGEKHEIQILRQTPKGDQARVNRTGETGFPRLKWEGLGTTRGFWGPVRFLCYKPGWTCLLSYWSLNSMYTFITQLYKSVFYKISKAIKG